MSRMSRGSRRRRLRARRGGACSLPAGAPAALADTSSSSNWAGYAVHRAGVQLRAGARAPGASRAPRASPATPTYSSVWVGLGGFSTSSNGARADRHRGSTAAPAARSSRAPGMSWCPPPRGRSRSTVSPGDEMQASVTVDGHEVHLELADLTRQHVVRARPSTLDARHHLGRMDRRGAVGVRSGNSTARRCRWPTSASRRFSGARAITTAAPGSVSNRDWTTDPDHAGGRRPATSSAAAGGAAAGAAPSTLSAGGTRSRSPTAAPLRPPTDPATPVTPVTPTPVTPARRSSDGS